MSGGYYETFTSGKPMKETANIEGELTLLRMP